MLTDAAARSEYFGDSPFLVICDHAANHIPLEFKNLGLDEDRLQDHIAWDIGAQALALKLAEGLRGRLLTCSFSRLLIDANRDPTQPDAIPPISDQEPIPGNQNLSPAQRQARIQTFFDPYHASLDQAATEFATKRQAFVVSVHSFTKRMSNQADDRPWDIGLLWHKDEGSAKAIMQWLAKHSDWRVGDNEPYDGHRYNYSVDRHFGARNMRHLVFEVRQDHLLDDARVSAVATLLIPGIQSVANSR